MKIKSIIRTWRGQLGLFSHDEPGPEVDIEPDEIDWPEVSESCWCKPEDATVYLYFKGGRPTIIVRFADLQQAMPEIATRAWDGFKRKISGPDPLHGSPS